MQVGLDTRLWPRRHRRGRALLVLVLGCLLALGAFVASSVPAQSEAFDFACSTQPQAQVVAAAPKFDAASTLAHPFFLRGTVPADFPLAAGVSATVVGGEKTFEMPFALGDAVGGWYSAKFAATAAPGDAGFSLYTGDSTTDDPYFRDSGVRHLFRENFALPGDAANGSDVRAARLSLALALNSQLRAALLARSAPGGPLEYGHFKLEVGMRLVFEVKVGTSTEKRYKDVTIAVEAKDMRAGSRVPATSIFTLALRHDDAPSPGTTFVGFGQYNEFRTDDDVAIDAASTPQPPASVALDVVDRTVVDGVTVKSEPSLHVAEDWTQTPRSIAIGLRQRCQGGGASFSSTGHIAWNRSAMAGPAAARVDVDVRSGIGLGVKDAAGVRQDELSLQAGVRGVPKRLDWVVHPRRVDIVRQDAPGEVPVVPDVALRNLAMAGEDPIPGADNDPIVVAGDVDGLPAHTRVVSLYDEQARPAADPTREHYTSVKGARILFCPALAHVGPIGPDQFPDDAYAVLPGEREPVSAERRPGCSSGQAPVWLRAVAQNFFVSDPAQADLVGPPADAAKPFVLYASRATRNGTPRPLWRFGLGLHGPTGGAVTVAKTGQRDRDRTSGNDPVVEESRLHADATAAGEPDAALILSVDDRTDTKESQNLDSAFLVTANVSPFPPRLAVDHEATETLPFRLAGSASVGASVDGTVKYLGPRKPVTVGTGIEWLGAERIEGYVTAGMAGPGHLPLPKAWELRVEETPGPSGSVEHRAAWTADAQADVRAKLYMSDRSERRFDPPLWRLLQVAGRVDKNLSATWQTRRVGVPPAGLSPGATTDVVTEAHVYGCDPSGWALPWCRASNDIALTYRTLRLGGPVPRFDDVRLAPGDEYVAPLFGPSPTPMPSPHPADVLPPLPNVPPEAQKAFPPLPDITGHGFRGVDLTGATGIPDYAYFAHAADVTTLDYVRSENVADGSGTTAPFTQFCVATRPPLQLLPPDGPPPAPHEFAAQFFETPLSDEPTGPTTPLYVEGLVDDLPPALGMHVRRELDLAAENEPGSRLAWFQTESCPSRGAPSPTFPLQDAPQPSIFDVTVRTGTLVDEPAPLTDGSVPTRPRDPARPFGVDVVAASYEETGRSGLDASARLALPRNFEMSVPSLRHCNAERPTGGICSGTSRATERDEELRLNLAWRSSAWALGRVDARVVLHERAPTPQYPDHVARRTIEGHLAVLPGTFTLAASNVTNTRLPWDTWDIDARAGNCLPLGATQLCPFLEGASLSIVDDDQPGYVGPWKPVPWRVTPEDAANRRPNTQVALHRLADRLHVRLDMRDSESPTSDVVERFANVSAPPLSDPGKEYCRSIGRYTRPLVTGEDQASAGPGARHYGMVYLAADVDMHFADDVAVRVRSGKEDPMAPDASQNAVVFEAARRGEPSAVDGTISFKQAVETSKKVEDSKADAYACLDLDLPVTMALSNVRRVLVGQQAAGLAVHLPDADRLAGADVSGQVGEAFATADGQTARSGAWYKHYLAHFDPMFIGDWLSDETSLVLDEPGATSGWKEMPVHPLATDGRLHRDCDEAPETDHCPFPFGWLDYASHGWTNEFGYGSRSGVSLALHPAIAWPSSLPGYASIAFMLDPLFAWETIDDMKDRDDNILLPGRPGQSLYEKLRAMMSPASDFRLPDRPPPSTAVDVLVGKAHSETVVCGDLVSGVPRVHEPAPRLRAADGTTYSVLFHETCDEESFDLSPNVYWTSTVDVYVVARHPNGQVRWARQVNPGGWEVEDGYAALGRPLPDMRAAADLLLGTDGAIQVRAEFGAEGPSYDEHEVTWRLDPSGYGAPVEPQVVIGQYGFPVLQPGPYAMREGVIPVVSVLGLPLAYGPGGVNVFGPTTGRANSPTVVALPEVVGSCATDWASPVPVFPPPLYECAGRVVYFGDGSQRQLRPDENASVFVHRYAQPGSYPLLVVTYDTAGRVIEKARAGRVDIT